MKYAPHMVTFFESIEHAILLAGWRKGVEALVASWVEYRRARIKWEETWEPDGRHRYFHETSSGIRFVIEWVARDKWALGVAWPDEWGHEHIGTGSLEGLQEEANQLAKMDGPFGGPLKPPHPTCAISPGRLWRVAGEVELRFEVLTEIRGAHLHVTRAGILNNHRIFNFDQSKLQEQVDSIDNIEPSDLQQWVLVEGTRRPWTHTAMRPLLAYMDLGERELLLVRPIPPTAVILAHTEGRLQTALTLDSSDLSDFDITWLDDAPRWPDQQDAWGYVEVIAGSAPLRAYTGPPGQNPHKPPPRVVKGAPRPSPSGGAGSPVLPSPPGSVASTTSRPDVTQPPPRAAETAQGSDSAGQAPQGEGSPPPIPISSPPTTAPCPAAAAPTPPPATSPPPSAPPTRVALTSAGLAPPSPPPTSPTGETELAATPSASTRPPTGMAAPTSPPLTVTPAVSPPAAPEPALAAETPTSPPASPDSSPPPTPTPEAAPQESTSREPHGAESPSPQPSSSAPEVVPPKPEQPKPRFPLTENPSPAEMERHFAEIEAAIPPKLTGAATAVEIWQALDQAHRHGALPITGGWIHLVSTLHRRGWLSRLPGDRATRAAFLILESLSPLVRRLHRRRWILGLER